MKKVLLIITLILACLLSACGTTYTCKDCNKSTTKAYYDLNANDSSVMCEECAREYWIPLDYSTYRVK